MAEATHRLPLSINGLQTVDTARAALRGVLRGEDPRTVVIAGPCSIHSPEEALAYARKLRALAEDVSDRVLILMRVYFEKPRTHVGWKGLVSDPHLNGSRALEDGLLVARQLLCEIADIGLPAATEFLDPLITGYLGDAVSWAAIGARTTESQTHRQLASGLGMPVGFKNGTDGGLDVAINAIKAAREPHGFLGVDGDGHIGIVETTGNVDTHVVLRGAGTAEAWRANYAAADVAALEKRLVSAGLPSRVLVDCSHANCGYDFRRQGLVVYDWIAQRENERQRSREWGNASSDTGARPGAGTVFGLMLESNLNEGRQAFGARETLRAGVSVTDGCIGWSKTEELVRRIYEACA